MGEDIFQIPASFRDPCGSVYVCQDAVVRTVNKQYAPHYQLMHESGFLADMWERGWMVRFEEEETPSIAEAWKTLRVHKIPFISFPYEWSFSQLKDAALLTLDIQEAALNKGLVLKDASAYNVQFEGASPVFIDVLSLETYKEGTPWVAYAQFCRHFLAPLLLMAKAHINSGLLLRDFIDGVPLDMASALLPRRSKLALGVQLHIALHAKMQKKHADTRASAEKARQIKVSKKTVLGLTQSLRGLVKSLRLPKTSTTWGDYYSDTNYSDSAFDAKHQQVKEMLDRVAPATVLDMGANTGEFSRLALGNSSLIIAADMDPLAVERHYLNLAKNKISGILPLVVDLSNPSPSLGWHNTERPSFVKRCSVDMVMALALIHHLCIGNNISLDMCARLLADLGDNLILEFVPKEDSQVQRMLSTREDIFPDYTLENAIKVFSAHFTYLETKPVPGSERSLVLFARK